MTSACFSAAILAGLLLAQIFALPVYLWIAAGIIALIVGIIFYRQTRFFILEQPKRKWARLLLFASVLFISGGRAAIEALPEPAESVINYIGETTVHFTAIITEPPKVTSSFTTIRVRLEKIQSNSSSPSKGMAEVRLSTNELRLAYGDRVAITGRLSLPPESSGFSYREYLARNGISAFMYYPKVEPLGENRGNPLLMNIYSLRKKLVDKVYSLFPKPESALMAGILLGDETRIPADIEKDFEKTGTAHIIAISGANFALITGLFLGILFHFFHFWWTPILMIPFVGFYTILVGGNPAVVRSAIMSIMILVGITVGRTKQGPDSLLFTAAIMGFYNPQILFDIGFQLSAAATLGILLFLTPLRELTGRILSKIADFCPQTQIRIVNFFSETLLISISAQIFTVFISAAAFHQISFISLFANFLIAIFQSFIMLGGLLTLILSFILPPLAIISAKIVWIAPAATIRIVQACAKIPYASHYVSFSTFNAWVMITLIVLLWIFRERIFRQRKSVSTYYAAMILLMAAAYIWISVFFRLDKDVKISLSSISNRQRLTVRTSEHNRILFADDVTSFSAQEMFEINAFFPEPGIAAFFDFSEPWMKKSFVKAAKWNAEPLLYLDGSQFTFPPNVPASLPDRINRSFHFSVDSISVETAAVFMKKTSWIIRSEDHSFLAPMGVPPEQIFRKDIPLHAPVDFILLGNADDPAVWEAFSNDEKCPESLRGSFPSVFFLSDCGAYTITLKSETIETHCEDYRR